MNYSKPEEPLNYLGAIADVHFRDGGHMVAWTQLVISMLRAFELLTSSAQADITSGIAHQRWRNVRGSIPPKIHAIRVTAPLKLALVTIKAARLAMEAYLLLLENNVIKPAKKYKKSAAEGVIVD